MKLILRKPVVSEQSEETNWLVKHLMKPSFFYPTGYEKMDKLIDGLHVENITIIGALPGVGKSTLIHNMINNMRTQRHSVWPTENSKGRWMEKQLSLLSGIPDVEIRSHKRESLEALRPHIEELIALPISVNDTYHPTLSQIEENIIQFRPEVVWIDYFQNVMLREGAQMAYREYTQSMEGLHALTIKYKIALVLGSQLKRPSGERIGKRPTIQDLKETSKLEEASKVIILLHPNGGKREANIAKARDLTCGMVEFDCDTSINKIEEAL